MRICSAARRLAVIFFAALVLSACVTAPPVREMSDARQVITAAEAAGADRFAPDEISAARRYIAEAEQRIAEDAYASARASALRARDRATRALRLSLDAAESQ
jgi:hypothetical protein